MNSVVLDQAFTQIAGHNAIEYLIDRYMVLTDGNAPLIITEIRCRLDQVTAYRSNRRATAPGAFALGVIDHQRSCTVNSRLGKPSTGSSRIA
ncbi:MAG: hypothetical protein PVI92_13475 [Chromatiales bacterium]